MYGSPDSVFGTVTCLLPGRLGVRLPAGTRDSLSKTPRPFPVQCVLGFISPGERVLESECNRSLLNSAGVESE